MMTPTRSSRGLACVAALAAFCVLVSYVEACAHHRTVRRHEDVASTGETLTQFLEVDISTHEKSIKPGKSSFRSIAGKIKLSGQYYQTSCQCSDSANSKTCNPPFRLHVHQEAAFNADVGLSRRDMKKVLGLPTSFVLRDVEGASFSCIEGRNNKAILGTPGGDFAEFVNALQVFSELTNSTFTEERVQDYLSDWLAVTPAPLYYHTDYKAQAALELALTAKGLPATGLDLRKPKPEIRAALLEELPKSPHQGCYVLKAMLSHPQRFQLDASILHGAIKALHKILWDDKAQGPSGKLNERIDYELLDGESGEKAFINFRGNPRCEDDKKAPVFTPRSADGTQVFVNHPEAIGVYRARLSRFFLTQPPQLVMTERQVWNALNRRGLLAMEVTAEVVGQSTVPFYSVMVE